MLIGAWLVLPTLCAAATPGPGGATDVTVVLETIVGNIEIAVDTGRAPYSAGAFLALVDDGSLEREGTFYRAVRKNENDRGHPAIDVIEGGLLTPPSSLPGIRHESTRQTGLRHLDGTVSLGRGAALGKPGGNATGADFFICIGDQPALDMGGGRDPFGDHQGFAAFGRVTQGMSVVRKIQELPTGAASGDAYTSGQMLDPPVRILRAYRKRTPTTKP